MSKLKVGKVYKVVHARKGTFNAKLVEDGPEWVSMEITAGVAEGLQEDWEVGEKIDIRKAIASFTPID